MKVSRCESVNLGLAPLQGPGGPAQSEQKEKKEKGEKKKRKHKASRRSRSVERARERNDRSPTPQDLAPRRRQAKKDKKSRDRVSEEPGPELDSERGSETEEVTTAFNRPALERRRSTAGAPSEPLVEEPATDSRAYVGSSGRWGKTYWDNRSDRLRDLRWRRDRPSAKNKGIKKRERQRSFQEWHRA